MRRSNRFFWPRTNFVDLVQDLLQAEFQIPEVYGTDTVIKKPNASASFSGVSLRSNKKKTRVARSLIFSVSVPMVCPNLGQTCSIAVCYRIPSYIEKTDFDTKNAPTLKDCISALDANFSTIFADSEGKWHQEWLCIKKFFFSKNCFFALVWHEISKMSNSVKTSHFWYHFAPLDTLNTNPFTKTLFLTG